MFSIGAVQRSKLLMDISQGPTYVRMDTAKKIPAYTIPYFLHLCSGKVSVKMRTNVSFSLTPKKHTTMELHYKLSTDGMA